MRTKSEKRKRIKIYYISLLTYTLSLISLEATIIFYYEGLVGLAILSAMLSGAFITMVEIILFVLTNNKKTQGGKK